MLTIRRHQIKLLEDTAVSNFAAKAGLALETLFPELAHQRGATAMREFIAKGIVQAESHGLITQRAVFKYLGLMFLLNIDFSQAGEPEWVTALLKRDTHSKESSLVAIQQRLQALPH